MLALLKDFREQRGLTQEKVADDLGIPYATYRNWEQQRTFPRKDKLSTLLAYFNCSIGDLVGDRMQVDDEPVDTFNTIAIDRSHSEHNIWTLVAIYHLITDSGKAQLFDKSNGTCSRHQI
jgi:transcriptional regulator with XRE-family HTH domain